MVRVSWEVRHSRPLYFSSTSWPLTSICGARPGEKMRSLTRSWALTMAVMSCAVWMMRGAEAGGGVCAGVGDGLACGGSVGVVDPK